MKTREDLRVDDKRWRKLCELVAVENDPKRLSQLLDQLLKELDARREAMRESERDSASSPDKI
jgi:pheromone shutdown protein TraB